MPQSDREAAFAAYRQYLCALQAIQISPRLRRKFGNSDLVQKTFVDILEGKDDLARMPEEQRQGYLRKMLLNNLRDEIRRYMTAGRDIDREVALLDEAERSSVSVEQWQCDQPTPPELAEQRELRERLLEALAKLPAEQAEAVILQHMHGWSLAEIAQHQECTVGMVAGRIRRGLEHLPSHLLDVE